MTDDEPILAQLDAIVAIGLKMYQLDHLPCINCEAAKAEGKPACWVHTPFHTQEPRA